MPWGSSSSRQERRGGISRTACCGRTNPAIKAREFRAIERELAENNIPCLKTQLHERAAFKSIFSYGGVLEDLNPNEVSNLDQAIRNAREYAAEVIEIARQEQKPVMEAAHG